MSKKPQQIIVKKERRIQITLSVMTVIKIILISFLLFCIWFVLHFKYVELYWNKEPKYHSIIFSIFVSMTFLMFLVGLGIQYSFEHFLIKLPIVLLILFNIYNGFQYIGIGFKLNYYIIEYFLSYTKFESNSKIGMRFFLYSIPFWFILWFIHLPFLSEKND